MTKDSNSKLVCGVCGFVEAVPYERDYQIKVPFSYPVFYKAKISHCNQCGADLRLESEKQSDIEDRIFKSACDSIPLLLEDLNRRGYEDDRIERALDLNKGTIKQWKEKKEITKEVVALIRLLYMLPQLIVVAEEQYDATKLFGI